MTATFCRLFDRIDDLRDADLTPDVLRVLWNASNFERELLRCGFQDHAPECCDAGRCPFPLEAAYVAFRRALALLRDADLPVDVCDNAARALEQLLKYDGFMNPGVLA